ncbi:hypothetical protein QEG73_09260 [Chitinophagaceae bacterium 26-R-25]|nr:hypothetical protein [Chitinophagaceae bacterium 26-R-25]
MRLILSLFISVLFTAYSFGQEVRIEKKNISDTVFYDQRMLIIPSDSLDAMKVMLKLFPGKLYDLSSKNYKDALISWECKKCKPATYTDVNGVEGDQQFPYKDGVATRLIDVIHYKDTKGNEYKILAFNHSVYDEDGAQTGRFVGGLLGLAKFAKMDGSWQMRSFQPAIAAFGSFASSPKPVPLVIGEDQYAFTVLHRNGGAGGPFEGMLFLIAGTGGKYRPILATGQYELTNTEKGETSWKSAIKVDNDSKKQYFRDIIITTKGYYHRNENEDDELYKGPYEIASFIKNKISFDFVIEKHYTFDGKHYKMKGKPVVAITNVK